MVVYQFIASPSYNLLKGNVQNILMAPHSSAFRAFTAGLGAFTETGLIIVIVCRTIVPYDDVRLMIYSSPLQAIYPTVIMMLVALNRSECDTIASYHGDGQDAVALPSIVFRGSALVHGAQSLDYLDDLCSAPDRASNSTALSLVDVVLVHGDGPSAGAV